ncbi:Eukaryotic translation initiation factor [Vigna angularis]|uniref:Eukaryotic translation initiation factor n=3 Tax=Phaseolus angularis TaxID=3914 RepID=A0A8T0KY26_PHAAN|nr:Eukaryotic translation initiation factor [Vigna angularis]
MHPTIASVIVIINQVYFEPIACGSDSHTHSSISVYRDAGMCLEVDSPLHAPSSSASSSSSSHVLRPPPGLTHASRNLKNPLNPASSAVADFKKKEQAGAEEARLISHLWRLACFFETFRICVIMALQNIGAGNSDDAFYRYKMPRMITKIEGRGNGIKTNVVNMVDIAKALARPASYTTKYFGCELGAQSKFDEKTGTSHVNGAHDTAKLAGLLEIFIKKYVQCYGCGNPETDILITKSQMIQLKCAACGFVSDVDMRDKLTTFIIKNPPEVKKGSKDKKAMRRAEKERLKEGEMADEEQKKLKKEVIKKKGTSSSKDGAPKSTSSRKKANGSDEDRASPPRSQIDEKNEAHDKEDVDDDIEWQTDTSLEAARQRIQEQLSAVTADMVMLSTDEPEKEEKTRTKVSDNSENGNFLAYRTLVAEVKANLNKGVEAKELVSHLAALPASAQEKMSALYEALFEGIEKGFAKEAIKKKNYLAAAVAEEEGLQLLLLCAIEEFSCKSTSNALKEVALVLKALYDADVLEEEHMVQWYQKGLKGDNKNSQIWKNAQPFIEWLQNAESESDEE